MISKPKTRSSRVVIAGLLVGVLLFSTTAKPAVAADTTLLGLVAANAPTLIAITAACYAGALLSAGIAALEGLLGMDVSTKDTNVGNQLTNAKCGAKLEKAAAQLLLKALTVSTVNWIKGGFHGNPLYPRDTNKIFKDLGDNALKGFFGGIGYDPTYHPFGKEFVKAFVDRENADFAAITQYNLDKVLAMGGNPGATVKNYEKDFVQGGWAAFMAQMDVKNSPIGFNLAAQEEANRIKSENMYKPKDNIKDMLQRTGGLLDVKKCMDPGYNNDTAPDNVQAAIQAKRELEKDAQDLHDNSAEAQAALAAQDAFNTAQDNEDAAQELANKEQGDLTKYSPGTPEYDAAKAAYDDALGKLTLADEALTKAQKDLDTANAADAAKDKDIDTNLASSLKNQDATIAQNTCKNMQTMTPGSVVGTSIANAINVPSNSLISGSDLSSALTAVFDALTEHFVSEGLTALNTAAGNPPPDKKGFSYLDNTEVTTTTNGGATGTGTPTPPVVTNDGNWLNENADTFNIFTDLQEIYQREIDIGNTYQQQSNIVRKIISDLYVLDYCIPGPHPSWDVDATNKIMQLQSVLPQDYKDHVTAVAGKIDNFLGYPLVGDELKAERQGNGYCYDVHYAPGEIRTFDCEDGDSHQDDKANTNLFSAILVAITGIVPNTINQEAYLKAYPWFHMDGTTKYYPYISGFGWNTWLDGASDPSAHTGPMKSPGDVTSFLQVEMDKYKAKIASAYRISHLPSETPALNSEWKKLINYQQGLVTNDDLIGIQVATARRVLSYQQRVHDDLAGLVSENYGGFFPAGISQTDIITNITPALSATGTQFFKQINADMATALLSTATTTDTYIIDAATAKKSFLTVAKALHSDQDLVKVQNKATDLQDTSEYIAGRDVEDETGLIQGCFNELNTKTCTVPLDTNGNCSGIWQTYDQAIGPNNRVPYPDYLASSMDPLFTATTDTIPGSNPPIETYTGYIHKTPTVHHHSDWTMINAATLPVSSIKSFLLPMESGLPDPWGMAFDNFMGWRNFPDDPANGGMYAGDNMIQWKWTQPGVTPDNNVTMDLTGNALTTTFVANKGSCASTEKPFVFDPATFSWTMTCQYASYKDPHLFEKFIGAY